MSRGRTPQLFSFSFLDILACTVGAVLFVLMVMALQLSEVTPQALPLVRRQALLDEQARLQQALEELASDALEDELERLRREAERARERIRALEDEVRAARARADAKEKTLARRKKKTVDLGVIRPRAVRPTRLRPGIELVCLEEGVEVVQPNVGEPHGDPPRRTVRLDRVALTPSEGVGRAGSDLDRRLRSLDRRKHFVGVMVREGGIESFRALRAHLKRRGFEVAWQPLPIKGREFDISASAPSSSEGPRTD